MSDLLDELYLNVEDDFVSGCTRIDDWSLYMTENHKTSVNVGLEVTSIPVEGSKALSIVGYGGWTLGKCAGSFRSCSKAWWFADAGPSCQEDDTSGVCESLRERVIMRVLEDTQNPNVVFLSAYVLVKIKVLLEL